MTEKEAKNLLQTPKGDDLFSRRLLYKTIFMPEFILTTI
jgi:hypothetical protein